MKVLQSMAFRLLELVATLAPLQLSRSFRRLSLTEIWMNFPTPWLFLEAVRLHLKSRYSHQISTSLLPQLRITQSYTS